MPWCHTCRIEYPPIVETCPECSGTLVEAPAPERRVPANAALVVVATLPTEQAFVATGRLDAGGIPSALREAGGWDGISANPDAVHVLVAPAQLTRARRVLRPGDRRHTGSLMGVLIFTGIALFLSAAILFARWLMSGSPLPR